MAVLFDTLKFVRELRPAFSQEQAEALATAVAASAQDNIATKADLAALRAELVATRAELKSDLSDLRVELKGDITTAKLDLARWIVTAIVFNFVATAGFFATALRVFR